ncbi:hypothetical protein GCM10010505_30560 [Kitasatospora aburaviensis]
MRIGWIATGVGLLSVGVVGGFGLPGGCAGRRAGHRQVYAIVPGPLRPCPGIWHIPTVPAA